MFMKRRWEKGEERGASSENNVNRGERSHNERRVGERGMQIFRPARREKGTRAQTGITNKKNTRDLCTPGGIYGLYVLPRRDDDTRNDKSVVVARLGACVEIRMPPARRYGRRRKRPSLREERRRRRTDPRPESWTSVDERVLDAPLIRPVDKRRKKITRVCAECDKSQRTAPLSRLIGFP